MIIVKIKKLERGDHVLISADICKTSKEYQSNGTMRDMAGKIHKIDDDFDGSRSESVHIRGFTWHINDIQPLNAKKKSQNFLFDEKRLVI